MEKAERIRLRLATAGNALTVARLVLLPLIVAGIATKIGWLTVGAMATALVTDLLDGRVARWLNQASQFGRTLDSTIDFVLIYSLFIAFYAANRLATYQFAVVYVAMLTNLMLQVSSIAAGAEEGVVRTRLGKLTGALQYVYLLFLVVREVLPNAPFVRAVDTVIFVALAAAVLVNSVECATRVRRIA